MGTTHNPVIGYVMVDDRYHIIGPPGTNIDPVFHTEKNAIAAAERYGRKNDVFKIREQYLEGIFNITIWDDGDMMLDGGSAQRFVKACNRRGLKPDKRSVKQINLFEKSNNYSARRLLGDIDFNRAILLSES